MTSLAELRKEFLRLLEVDEEFRLVVAAKLGLLEILNELKRLREDFNKLYQKSLEHDKRFEEMNRRFEAIEKKLLEHDKRFEEMNRRFEAIERKLLEHDKRFEEINKRFETIERRLEEHDKKFNEILEEIRRIWETLAEHNRRLSHVEDTLGALAESFYAKYTLDLILQQCAYEGDRVVQWIRNARVDEEDIDLLVVTERRVYIVEVKVRPKHGDVGRLLAKADVVKRVYADKEVIPILAGTRIGKEILDYATSKGVLVHNW